LTAPKKPVRIFSSLEPGGAVKMPSYIIENKKSYSYVVESTPVYDKKTKATSGIKKYIGKLDKSTNEIIFKPEFINNHPNRYIIIKGQNIDILNPKLIYNDTEYIGKNNINLNQKELIVDNSDINNQKIESIIFDAIIDFKKYGGSYFLFNLANNIGLLDTLKTIFKNNYAIIFTIMSYLILENEKMYYCEDWQEDNFTLTDQKLTSQYISNLFNKITQTEKNKFYQTWIKKVRENEFLALDITSISSNSKNIEEVDFGHSKGNPKLPQINLCILFGEKSGLPMYQTTYEGSMTDVVTLKNTITEFSAIIGDFNFKLVMDRGFYSQDNVNYMIAKKELKFILGVPFTNDYAKELVNMSINNIDIVDDYIKTTNNKDTIRGTTKYALWTDKFEMFLPFDQLNLYNKQNILALHIYSNQNKRLREIDEFTQDIDKLKNDLMDKGKLLYIKNQKKCDKFLIITFDELNKNKIINIQSNKIAIQEHIKYFGYSILMSNDIFDKKDCYLSYVQKDVAEKSFNIFKQHLGLDRPYVHGSKRMINKTFLIFLAQILYCSISKVMFNKNLFKSFSMHKLLLRLNRIKLVQVNDKKMVRSVTKAQNDIFSAFNIPLLKNNEDIIIK
jgi:transposase